MLHILVVVVAFIPFQPADSTGLRVLHTPLPSISLLVVAGNEVELAAGSDHPGLDACGGRDTRGQYCCSGGATGSLHPDAYIQISL